tara:strand:- start:349 stop:555 length:207 start_codon:yes stop_codon:yes gene_type:complete
MPIKSLDISATFETIGSSVISIDGNPDIGKSRPFDILITLSVPYKSYKKTSKKQLNYKLKIVMILEFN